MAVIHPMWAMEEYARIFRSWVWFSPPQPPTRMDSMDIVSRIFRLIECEIWYRIERGASFCQVRRISPDDRGMPCVTSGTQKWNGDRPSFMVRAKVIIVEAVGLRVFMTVHWPEWRRFMMMASMSSMDAVACVRKYLVDASVDRGLDRFIIMGIIASMFISKPIQTSSQCELIITMRVPRMMVNEMVVRMRGFISTGRM